MNDDPVQIAAELGRAIEAVNGSWAVGGSVASSIHGIPRSTQDIDLVVSLSSRAIGELARHATAFAIDEDALRADFAAGRSANVFHLSTMTKLDLFPAREAFERGELARAVWLGGIRVVTAEDAILAKLRWFRKGNCVSDRQWRDVLGMLEIRRPSLDLTYLESWAATLDVSDLLTRALADDSAGV